MWVDIVVGSPLDLTVYIWILLFSSIHKNQNLNLEPR